MFAALIPLAPVPYPRVFIVPLVKLPKILPPLEIPHINIRYIHLLVLLAIELLQDHQIFLILPLNGNLRPLALELLADHLKHPLLLLIAASLLALKQELKQLALVLLDLLGSGLLGGEGVGDLAASEAVLSNVDVVEDLWLLLYLRSKEEG